MADRGALPEGSASLYKARAIARRARNIAAWSIAFFIAAVPSAIVGGGMERTADGEATTGTALAMLFWLLGVVAGLWSFVLAFRHWDRLPMAVRWLASLPLLVVLFLIAGSALVTAIG